MASLSSYILPADMLVYYDANKIVGPGGLAYDQGDTVPTAADLSSTGSKPYSIVMSAIRASAGEVDGHAQIGLRYARADLEAMIDAAVNPPGTLTADQVEEAKKRAEPLRRLVADLTFGRLMARRGFLADAMRDMAPQYEAALATLDKLADGLLVFDLDANLSASVPQRVRIGSRKYLPSRDNRMFGTWNDQFGNSLFPQ